jgi:hypothetical protein
MTLAVLLTVARATSAQPAPWQPERLTEGWTFTPSIVVGGLWDSNVTVRNQGDPFIQEYVGLISPRGEMNFNGRHTRFNVGYSGALEAYRRFQELNNYEQRGRLSLRQTLSPRLTFETRGSYAVTPTTDRLEIGTLPFLDIGSTVAEIGGTLQYRPARHTHLTGDYRVTRVMFDRQQQPLQAFLNGGHAQTPSVDLTQELSARVSVGGEWSYTHAILEANDLTTDNTFNVQNVLGHVSYRLSKTTIVSGAAGGSNLNVATTGLSLWGPAFKAGIEHTRERLRVSARYSRAFVPSFSFGGLTGNQDVAVSATAPLTRGGRLTLSGSTSFTRTEPVKELGLGFQLDSVWYSGAIGYQIAPWLRTEGFVSSMHQTSTARGDIDRTRVGIQFVSSKPLRIE